MAPTFTFLFKPADTDNTCKKLFSFDLQKEGGCVYINNLTIEGDKGCVGHPKTISALLKGRNIGELPVEELSVCTCARDISCGQQVAKALQQIKNGGELCSNRP